VWKDDIKMDLKEIGGGSMEWIEMSQNTDEWRALVDTEMNIRFPYYV
jgi:hypothetical protein